MSIIFLEWSKKKILSARPGKEGSSPHIIIKIPSTRYVLDYNVLYNYVIHPRDFTPKHLDYIGTNVFF